MPTASVVAEAVSTSRQPLPTNWDRLIGAIEDLEDLRLERELVAAMQGTQGARSRPIRFHTPSFKSYQTSEIGACGAFDWPAISITGAECKLRCDHCKGHILETMLPATDPEQLWRRIDEVIGKGARGALITGGSNHRNEVEYTPFLPVLRRIKSTHPGFTLALHTGLCDAGMAGALADAGVDLVMIDIIGDPQTITHVYHLKRSPADFERSLEALGKTSLRVLPHIVVGLHYGELRGEWNALDMVARHRVDGLVLVVAMPFYASPARPFRVPDTEQVARFFLDARRALPDHSIFLGCARPPGMEKARLDAYAVLCGLDGIAHPSEGIMELATRLGRPVDIAASCCSLVPSAWASERAPACGGEA